MDKKVLILVISKQQHPYGRMMLTSLNTWDQDVVPGVETIFYCGEPVSDNADKIIYFPVEESLFTMGKKTLLAYEWALKNKEFDYIARVNASTYVDKKQLIKYVQTLPETECFAGLEVAASETSDRWMWGPQFILSRDLIELIVENQELWDHSVMDDNATSKLLNRFNVPYTAGKMCSLEKRESGWFAMCYGSESFEFTDFKDLRKTGQHFYRVKQDHDRNEDKYLMEEIYKAL